MPSYNENQRKLLKLQFAKADRNKDGQLELIEFSRAFEGAKRILPNLNQIPLDVANANFKTFATSGMCDIAGFLRIIDKLNQSGQARADSGDVPLRPKGAISGAQSKKRLSAVEQQRQRRQSGAGLAVPAKEASGTLRQRASETWKGLGKWFGVSSDADQDMVVMRDSFIRRKSSRRGTELNVVNAFDSPVTVGIDEDMDSDDEQGKKAPQLIYDYQQAISHYRAYIAREKRLSVAPKNATRKRTAMASALEMQSAKTQAARQERRSNAPAPDKKHKLVRDQTDIQLQLRAMPTFEPTFIPLMTFIQFALIMAICVHSYTRQPSQFARIGLLSATTTCSDGGCPDFFNGSVDTAAERKERVNIWVGPESSYLIQFCAKYTPCMREDDAIYKELAETRELECGIDTNPCSTCQFETVNGYTGPSCGYSCCSLQNATRFGMADKETCQENDGVFCPANDYSKCSEKSNIVLRPCCIGNGARCELLTENYCSFKEGTFHEEAQLCSEVDCLSEVCETFFGDTLETNPSTPNQPVDPNQWYRFIVPLFLHAGLIHFFLCMLIQWIVGRQIEVTAGWLRVLLIYFISGIGGYVISGIFDPKQVTVGSDPAVFGLLAVLVVELFQSWQIVPNPGGELAKLLFVIVVALAIGILPFIDNYGHIAGFVFGVFSACIFLPYVTFGKWDSARKRIVLIVSVPVLMVLFALSFVGFYLTQDTEFCGWCKSLNCVQFVSDIECDTD